MEEHSIRTPRRTRSAWRDYAQYARAGKHTVVGTVKVLPHVRSPQRGNTRDLLVYLPPSYAKGDRRYPVIYMHDGQNLFDQATSYAGEWCVDEIMEGLSREGIEAIIVGIPNAGLQRLDEYSPFKDSHGRGGAGDQYLAFIIETIKPLVDRDFLTLAGRSHTGIFGSSMGGLISLYAFFRHPHIFGLAGAMSPSIWFAERAILPYVQAAPFVPGRLYLDMGTQEGPPARAERSAGHAIPRRFVTDVGDLTRFLIHKGYAPGRDLLYVEDDGGMHNEADWSRRLPDALRFLLSSGYTPK